MSRTSVHYVGLHYIITMHGTKNKQLTNSSSNILKGIWINSFNALQSNWQPSQKTCSHPLNVTRWTATVKLRYIRNMKCFYKNETKNSEQKNMWESHMITWKVQHFFKHTPTTSTHATVCPVCMTFRRSKVISCCYPNKVWSFLYEYVYLNYAFSPSSGALVRTTTIESVGYLLALREMTKFCKISHYYPVCGHAFPPMTGNLTQ